MNMYHDLLADVAKEKIESNGALKFYLRELCHKFKLKVFSDYYSGRYLLLTENNVPFGVASLSTGQLRDGTETQGYDFIAPFVKKDRGRGSDRYTRTSVNIKNLLKTIESDIATRGAVGFSMYATKDIYANFHNMAADAANMRYVRGISLSDKTATAVVMNYFNKEPLTSDAIEEFNKVYQRYCKEREAMENVEEACSRFVGNCYAVLRFLNSPVIVTKVNISKDRMLNVWSDLGKCYTTMNELAVDYPDLAVSLKMFYTKNEKRIMDSQARIDIPANHVCEINTYLPWGTNLIDTDLDVVTAENREYGLTPYSNMAYTFVPVATNAL